MEELYCENAKIVFHFLLAISNNKDIAEELTQETFLKAYQSIGNYDGRCKISTWLCSIAKNAYYQYLSKNKRQVPDGFSGREEVFEVTPEREALAKIELLDVLKLMQKLPGKMREVMYLRITGALSFKEIGEILGKSENWARVNFYRGKERIVKEYYSGEGGEEHGKSTL